MHPIQTSDDAEPRTTNDSPNGLTRRRFLRDLAAGSAAAVGGAAALSAGSAVAQAGGSSTTLRAAQDAEVTIQTSVAPGSFFGPMPDAEQQKDPQMKAYGETLQGWLDANPGVKLETVSVDVWDQQTLLTSITGGTAPANYPGPVLGGWDLAPTRSAFVQGLAANLTALMEQFTIRERINPTAAGLWDQYALDGVQYSVPGDIMFSGTGMFYRRDLFQAAGLEEPKPGWTWADVRTLAKPLTKGNVKGVGLELWAIGLPLNAEGFDLLTQLPDPETDWHWRWDYMAQADQWASIVQGYRDMVFTDKTVLADITFDMPQINDAFIQGTVAMAPLNSGSMNVTGPGMPELAKSLNTSIDEVVGFVAMPIGSTGAFGGSQPSITPSCFSPDLDETALEKAVDLYTYFWYREGYQVWRKAVYDLTQDLAPTYNAYAPVNGITQIEGVPGSVEDVWPKNFLASARVMNDIPLLPTEGLYIPAEANPGPTGTAWDDTQSRWAFEPGQLDLRADLQSLQGNRNAEAAGFASSVSAEEFVTAAKAYYDAHATFWQEHAPDFYSQTFKPWYDVNVTPVLG